MSDTSDKDSVASPGSIDSREGEDILNTEIDISPEGSPEGSVIKVIHQSGVGWERPHTGCKVEVHYTGTLLDGSKFDSSLDRGRPFEFDLGKGQVIKGWDIGVATMRVGEKCTLTIKPGFAYGAAGSPPKIPKDATLKFQVELLSFSDETDVTYGRKTVMKRIKRQSDASWRMPKDFSACKVIYEVSGPDGEDWGSSPSADQPEEFVIGEDDSFPGFETALRSMKLGEAAELRIALSEMTPMVRSKFKGKIPDNVAERDAASSVFAKAKIDLVAFDSEKDTYEMTPDEKYTSAIEMKEKGNAAFKEGRLPAALRRYERGIDVLRSMKDFSEELIEKSNAVVVPCHLNAAQVNIKLGDLKAAVKCCTDALKVDEKNIKAHYRRAEAKRAMKEPAEAAEDLEAALKIDPEHGPSKALLAHCRADIRKIEKKKKNMYSRMFGANN